MPALAFFSFSSLDLGSGIVLSKLAQTPRLTQMVFWLWLQATGIHCHDLLLNECYDLIIIHALKTLCHLICEVWFGKK